MELTRFFPTFAIFTGAGFGGLARYSLVNVTSRLLGSSFPYGTLLVNLVGGLALGLLVGYWTGQGASPFVRAFLVTGLLGGFTTFSAFTLDSVTLVERHQASTALAYVLASVCGAILALAAGAAIGRHFAS